MACLPEWEGTNAIFVVVNMFLKLIKFTLTQINAIMMVSEPYPWAHNQGKGLQRCGPRMNPGVTFHATRSARECEGMNPHIPK
jgi:hypothetical protein